MQFIMALYIGTLVVVLKILFSTLAVETYNTDVALRDTTMVRNGKCSFGHKLPQRL